MLFLSIDINLKGTLQLRSTIEGGGGGGLYGTTYTYQIHATISAGNRRPMP